MSNERDALAEVRDVLAHAPIDCLGEGRTADGQTYPIRDEVIDRITKALAAQPAGAVEPIGWVFQHDDTGRMTFCENDGVNNAENFAANNPRHVLCGPAYTAPPAASVDVEGLRTLVDEMEAANYGNIRNCDHFAARLRKLIDSAGGAKVERPERCTECRSSTFETRHDGSFICANCKTIHDTLAQQEPRHYALADGEAASA